MFLYETHMHSSQTSACSSAPAEDLVRFYFDRGYTGAIITDHFINGNSSVTQHGSWAKRMAYFAAGYHAAKKTGNAIGFDVFFGLEFSIKGSDFLTYGIDTDFLDKNPDIDKFPINKFSKIVRDYGGYIAQAHPFRNEWYIENKYPAAPEYLDGIEVFNASMMHGANAEANDMAREFALKHGLAMQAGSDIHCLGDGFTSGIILQKRAKNIFDIINEIKNGTAELLVP